MKTFKLTSQQEMKLKKSLLESKGNIWKPKEGESVYGSVVSIKDTETKKGKKVIKSKLVTLNTKTGEVKIWLSTVLANQFKQQNIKVGSVVGIKFIEDNGSYLNYTVAKL